MPLRTPWIAATLDRFVPPDVRERNDDDAVRARTAVGVALLAAGVFSCLGFIRVAAGDWSVAGINALQAAFMLAFPPLLRSTGRVKLLINLAFAAAYASFLGLCIFRFGGGLTLPGMGLAITPLLTVSLAGMRAGFAWLLLCCFGITLTGLLAAYGVIGMTGTRKTLVAEHASLIVVAGLLYLIAGLYEYRKNQALSHIRELEKRRNDAERARIEALAEAKISEAERLASLGEIAAMTAHEINNPLSYVANNLEFIAELVPRPDAELQGALEDARDGVRRIQRIVTDLQQHGRPEHEEGVVANVRNAIATALKTVEGHTRPRARVRTEIAEVPDVVASHGRLVQVLLNLVVNAAQAIPEGRADQNEIFVRARTERDRVFIEIRDTGPGIPESILGRVKDTFFTTKSGRGSGLGLALCERVLRRFGGELYLENEGGGALARVVLRVSPVPAPVPPLPGAATPDASPDAEPRARRRILVVDDEPLVARGIRRSLRGHDVTVARSGREALALLEQGSRFDVILCDLMMPDLTGMDVYERVAENDPALASGIVFMTGGTFTDRVREFRDRVPNQFLEKPIDSARLRVLTSTRSA